MAYVEWNEKWCVGVEQIDEQHQHFIGLVNDFYNALEVGAQWTIVDDTIVMLLSYAQYHFHSEEKLMERLDYPKIEPHVAEHRRFAAKAEELDMRERARDETLPLDVFRFLTDWLTDHIATFDRELADFMANHPSTQQA